jgi:hypothetical protein
MPPATATYCGSPGAQPAAWLSPVPDAEAGATAEAAPGLRKMYGFEAENEN